MSVELKIKSKHLALEPAIIRCEERKLKKQLQWAKANGKDSIPFEIKRQSLSDHRKKDVRNEARATYLARAYLAGKPYLMIERKTYDRLEPIFPRVYAMVLKYGNNRALTQQELWAWFYTRAV